MVSKPLTLENYAFKCKRCKCNLTAQGPMVSCKTGVFKRWFGCGGCGDQWQLRWTETPTFVFQFSDHKIASTSRWKRRRQRPTLFKDVKS